jgi:hypothetical protein
MYKEPLMLEKYEALQELYLKDPLRPLQVCFVVMNGSASSAVYKVE